MQYSPMCAVPYVSTVDGGTVELIRSLGVEVVSSAELIQVFEARWTPEGLGIAPRRLGGAVDRVREAPRHSPLIHERTRNGVALQEVEVKAISSGKGFADAGMITDSGPIVGANANASNPHYEPSAEITSPIPRLAAFGCCWTCGRSSISRGAVYYDITWTAFCGDSPSDEIRTVYETVTGARDAGIKRVTEAIRQWPSIMRIRSG